MFIFCGVLLVIVKVLDLVIVNVIYNLNLNLENLFVKEVWVNELIIMKRMLLCVKGSGYLIRKCILYIIVVVVERE